MGLFSVRIMPLEAAGGPVQAHYQQSRASQDLAALLGILGGAALLGSTYAWKPFDESSNGTGMLAMRTDLPSRYHCHGSASLTG